MLCYVMFFRIEIFICYVMLCFFKVKFSYVMLCYVNICYHMLFNMYAILMFSSINDKLVIFKVLIFFYYETCV